MSRPPSNADEIAIQMLRPVAPGIGTLTPGSQDKVILARAGKPTGAEITWIRSRRAFRVEWFENNKPAGTRWVPEARVEEYTEL